MKIAFLVDKANYDKYAEGIPAEWELAQLGNGPTDEEKLAATDAEAILVDPMIRISASVISKMPGLKVIHSFGVGYNGIDCDAAAKAGIYVCNNAGVNDVAVAEQTVLLMLAVLRKYHYGEQMTYSARQGEFKGMCFRDGLRELGECRVGLIGFGAIGKETALRLAPFGCEVSYFKPHPIPDPERYHATPKSEEELFASSDIVSLHLPVRPDTERLINDTTLNKMKRGAILINTSRGELVDEEAVCRALADGRLGGFGADTLAPEPVRPDDPIINLPEELRRKVALSPHIGGITANTFRRSYKKAIKNISLALAGGRPENIVNGL